MICHEKKAIFIHIPRNAGRSMEAYIGERKPLNPHHKDLEMLAELKAGEYSDYFSFAIIRNPYDRMVSIFHYYTEGGNGSSADRKIQKILSAMGFYAFIKNLDNLVDIIPGYQQELYPFVIEQHKYICDGDANLLLDYVGVYEYLDEDVAYIGKQLGIQRDFPHKNRSDHDAYQNYYDAELSYIVAEKYSRDIELFYPHSGEHNGAI